MYGQLMAGDKQFVHCREVVLLLECPLLFYCNTKNIGQLKSYTKMYYYYYTQFIKFAYIIITQHFIMKIMLYMSSSPSRDCIQ